MEQTKRGRACEQELRRYKLLLEDLPTVKTISTEDILIEDVSSDFISVRSLCDSGCSVVDRSAEVLSQLLEEAANLAACGSERHFPALLLYAEDASSESLDECSTIRLVASFLPGLHSMSQFLSRVNQVFRNLLQQLRAFHLLQSKHLPSASERVLTRSWRCLGELLALLIQMDEICNNRPIIRQSWKVYMRALETAQHNPSQFGTSAEQLRPLVSTLALIEGHVMAGNGLRNCYEQSFGELDDDAAFVARFKTAILDMYSKWEKAAEADVPEKRRLMVIVGLSVFYHLHFRKPDKKVIKSVWNSHKKVVVFFLLGDILWCPCQFILKEVPEVASLVDKKSQLFIGNFKSTLDHEAMLDEACAVLPAVREWQTELRLEMRRTRTVDAASSLRLAEMVLKGSRLADTLSRLLKTVLNGHSGSVKMSKKSAYKVFEVVETVKSICHSFRSHWRQLVEASQLACQQWRCHVLVSLDKMKNSLREAGDTERLAAVQIAINAMLYTVSRTRLAVCGVALELAQYEKVMRSSDILQLEGLLTRLHTLCQPRQLVHRISDCSFLVFHRSLIDIYFDTMMDRMPTTKAMECFWAALTDCSAYVEKAAHESSGDETSLNLRKCIYEAARKGFLAPLCAFIENDLRILTHKHLVVDERDKTTQEMSDFFKRIFCYKSIKIHGTIIDVKEYVSAYLEKTFYNLTAVALHDCHTYSKMASLAQERYGLTLTAGDLPHNSLDQGLDIMLVVRSLQMFTAQYNYCINQQVFFEKDSPNRSLRVVTPAHMTASLRTHGCGILNTSVNMVYQLLRKRLATVSQFLADEHIRAQLQRDRRHFEESKEDGQAMFPVMRAEKFNRAMARLGDGEEEQTYMDRIREVITQMGNAVGLVRSMTSAAAAMSSESKEYEADGWGQSDDTVEPPVDDGTSAVRKVMNDSREQAGRIRDYIKMLVDVFRSGLADRSKFAHVDTFFVLVPALMLNYMEHMLTCRERLRKRTQHGRQMTFVDDGFVLGIAYLLSVFCQWNDFSSLNWLESLKKKLQEDGESMNQQLAETNDRRADALRYNRVNEAYKEYHQMMYSFTSSRVFFSYDDDTEF